MKKIKVGIMGAAGYTGGELLRLLVHHPNVELVFAHSNSKSGLLISNVHEDLLGDCTLRFTNEVNHDIDVVFLCVSHGEAKKLVRNHTFFKQCKIIDLSQDFRNGSDHPTFVYGLPELNRLKIKKANKIANPGCFATAIQLALLPLLDKQLLHSDVHIHATTGSTGAGVSLAENSHFSWRNNNLSVYKAFTHQHLHEIKQTIGFLQAKSPELYFIPQRGAFSRGILACITLELDLPEQEVADLFEVYYSNHPFIHLKKGELDLKQVVNTNKCFLHLQKHGNHLLITSAIDNLLKGASGQAVQNMNLLFGLEETAGLKLKATAF